MYRPTRSPFAYGLCNCGLRANVWTYRARSSSLGDWRDWKGDLVPSSARIFGKHFPIHIPPELADEGCLLAHLGLSPKELKKIWWYRGQMYAQFSIAKGGGKARQITAPGCR